MQSTNIQFIYHIVEQDNLKWFTIFQVNGAVAYDYTEEDATPDSCKNAIDKFLELNKGVWKIVFRNKPKRGGAGRPSNTYQYTINNIDSSIGSTEESSPMMNNQLAPSDDRFYNMLRELQEENRRLQNEQLAGTLNHMQESNRLQMELMQKNFELQQKGKEDGMSQFALQALGSIFGSPQQGLAGVSGVEDEAIGDFTETQLNDMEQAIQDLIKIDQNFDTNIQKLAKLAKSNKTMYNQAIKMLNNMA